MYIWLHRGSWFGRVHNTEEEAIDGAKKFFMERRDVYQGSKTTYEAKVELYEVKKGERVRYLGPGETDPIHMDVDKRALNFVRDERLLIDYSTFECGLGESL